MYETQEYLISEAHANAEFRAGRDAGYVDGYTAQPRRSNLTRDMSSAYAQGYDNGYDAGEYSAG